MKMRLSDLEPRFVCAACGKRGADVRPNFDCDRPGALSLGFQVCCPQVFRCLSVGPSDVPQ
jgi:hypothetical protein